MKSREARRDELAGLTAGWPEHERRLVGYAEPWTVRPGERVAFKVSTPAERFDAQLVQLTAPDEAVPLDSAANGSHPGGEHPLPHGSSVAIEQGPALGETFAVALWVHPTLRDGRPHALLAAGGPEDGCTLALDADGVPTFAIGGEAGPVLHRHGAPLALHHWHLVVLDVDCAEGVVELRTVEASPSAGPPRASHGAGLGRLRPPADRRLALAAAPRLRDGAVVLGDHLDGKLDAPAIYGQLLGEQGFAALAAGRPPAEVARPLGAWRLFPPADGSSTGVEDVSGNGAHGRAVNRPAGAVTGWNWTGEEHDWRHAPEQYGALHFHADDLEDALWPTSVEVPVPDDLPSGIYALRLRADGEEDVVPFFVAAPPGDARSDVALLMPTFSYLAYANESDSWTSNARFGDDAPKTPIAPEDRYVIDNRLLSLYEVHEDGSGTSFASRRRPIANLRPDYVLPVAGTRHQLSADLELESWLRARGVAHDVLTDEELHDGGAARLEPYRVVLTGSHPEYWSRQMLDGVERYLAQGGRVMYLGGNGLYWVTSVDAHAPHVCELRRGHAGTRSWESGAGELHHATTGELGGLWLHRGRAPQRLVGVGFTGQGNADGRPYLASAAAREPRYARFFEGIDLDAPIGERGTTFGAAASFEVDGYDERLGAPVSAVVLATSTPFGPEYECTVEGIDSPPPWADIVLSRWPNGGAVFAVGSIGWCGALRVDGEETSAGRLTANALAALRDPELEL